MNGKRAAGWLTFLGVAAVLAWAPGYFLDEPQADEAGVALATPAKPAPRSVLPAAPARGDSAPIRDLSPVGDLFASHSWKAAPTLATVTEQPLSPAPVVPAPSVPPMPFQFVGRLDDRRDLQVFLQDGEKIYVVRKGDVIDETWRVEGISELELSFVYLPLHVSRTLSVGSSQ
ncbi:hypothetical protein [Pseudomonas sp. zfem002]|uniref:hypothetical protein n=1 Tax=Pseudomonas sp. zfem002 TaxID=3078197 RepID=UPI0029289547|nr:hypothetical protein [Pseudomonas sp. zfem002]MDU9392059.1 hypothetical protein [Pseudomonas sp. zfem002]